MITYLNEGHVSQAIWNEWMFQEEGKASVEEQRREPAGYVQGIAKESEKLGWNGR